MTYNIQSCRRMDNKTSVNRIAQIIETHSPDIVGLQEVDLGRARSRWHDQARMIGDELGMHVYFCPTVVKGSELYGHAVLSRMPMEVVKNSAYDLKVKGRREPRGAIWLRSTVGAATLHFINTHLGLGWDEREEQVNELMGTRWIGGIPPAEPVILCGDFNMFPNTAPYKKIVRRLRDAQRGRLDSRVRKTFPVMLPFNRIDHIFLSNHFVVNGIDVPRNHLTRLASDHLPIVADLEWRNMPSRQETDNLGSRAHHEVAEPHGKANV